MKLPPLTVALASLISACSPETGGGNGIVRPMSDAGSSVQPVSRLYVDEFGSIFDRALDNQECTWLLLHPTCAKVCLPIEPMFPACDGQGQHYQYTRQALNTTFKYGRVTHWADLNCSGQVTYDLVSLSTMNTLQRKQIFKPQTCDNLHNDLTPDLYDRQWYTTMPATIDPATPQDLPGAGPS